ncbi:MAG: PilZ domain-containing protein [Planctomycetota bacterium]|nr:PilZ domain-containing protein [Planctomycetota bacterium]
MSKDDQLRTSVRLKIEKGIVLLRSSGVPSVACALQDLSEGGCRCIAPVNTLDTQTSEAWIKILGPGRSLSIEISCPPFLQHFPIDAEVRVITPSADGGIDLGLRFRNLDADQMLLLSQAMLSFATAKVRVAFAPGQQGEAAQYLVGGRTLPGGARAPSPSGSNPAVPAVPPPPSGSSASSAAISNTHAPAVGEAPAPGPGPGSNFAMPAAVRKAASRSKSFEAVPSEGPAAPVIGMPAAAPVIGMPAAAPTPLTSSRIASLKEVQEPAAVSGPAPAVPPAPPAPGAPAKPAAPESSAAGDPFRGRRIGEVLVKMGKLTDAQVQDSVQRAKISGERLGRYLLREGLVSPAELCRALALQSGLPMTDITDAEIPEPLGMLFSHGMMLQHEFVPFDESLRMLCVAAANPIPRGVIEEMERSCGKKIEVFLAQEDTVLQLVDRLQPKEKRKDRKHMRYEAALPIHYQFCNRLGRSSEETIHQGLTIDLSEGGFLIQGPATGLGGPDDLMRRGLCVRFSISDTQTEVKGLCALRFIKNNERPSREEWKWHYGLQILEMTTDDRRKLKELCIQAGMRQSKLRTR